MTNRQDSSSAKKWDEIFQAGAKFRDLNEVFVWQLIEKFKSSSKVSLSHVVDLGCGTGETLARFRAHGLGVTGIDFSQVALTAARQTLALSDEPNRLIEADLASLSNLTIETPVGTLWLGKLVLAFIDDKEKFLMGVKEKMKSGDMLLIMTPIIHGGIIYQPEDKPGIAMLQEEVERLVRSVFGRFEVFSNEYPGERGHIISYLVAS